MIYNNKTVILDWFMTRICLRIYYLFYTHLIDTYIIFIRIYFYEYIF